MICISGVGRGRGLFKNTDPFQFMLAAYGWKQ